MSRHMKIRIFFGFAAVYIIWGSTYLAILFGVETMPPFLMAAVRFLLGGTLLYGWAKIRGAKSPARTHWGPAFVLGLLMPGGGTGLVTWAETMVPSGLTALIVATVPLWVVLVDWVRPNGNRPRILVIAGLVLGFGGVALLINPTGIGGIREMDLFGAILIVIAALSWAVGSIYSRHAHQPESKLLGVGMQMLCGAAGLFVVSLFSGEMNGFTFAQVSTKSWLSLGYLATAGSMAFAAYVWLLSVSTPAKAATYAYVNPVIALMLGAVLAGEVLSDWALGCSVVIIVSVIVIITARATSPRRVVAETTLPPCQPAGR